MRNRRNSKPVSKSSDVKQSRPANSSPDGGFYNSAAMSSPAVPMRTPFYVVTDRHNPVEVSFHRCQPFANFCEGWHEGTGYATDYFVEYDSLQATSSTSKPGRTVADLAASSPVAANTMTRTFVEEVWPLYEHLFTFGLNKSQSSVTMVEFYYVQAQMIHIANLYTDLINWSTVLEGRYGAFQRNIEVLGNQLLLGRASVRTRLSQIEAAMERLPIIPEVALEIRRMKTPFYSALGAIPNFIVPQSNLWGSFDSGTVDTHLTLIERCIELLEGNFHQVLHEIRLRMKENMSQFFFREMNSNTVTIDLYKTEGRMNSYPSTASVNGNDNDPISYPSLRMTDGAVADGFVGYTSEFTDHTIVDITAGESDADALIRSRKIMSLTPMYSNLSLLSSSLWCISTELIDDAHTLLTPHLWAEVQVPTRTAIDNRTVIPFGVNSEGSHVAESYKHLARGVLQRFIQEDTDEFYLPEGVPQTIVVEEVLDVLRHAARYFFGSRRLKEQFQVLAGSGPIGQKNI